MTAMTLAGGQFPRSWMPYLTELIGRESSWNHKAKNPKSTASGYGQFIDSTKRAYEKKYGIKYDNNPVGQIALTMHYIKDRYGTPQAALAFWDQHHYY